MNPASQFIIAAGSGAICQEILYWWELRNNLMDEKYQSLLKSRYYWILVVLMITASGAGTYFLCFEEGITKMQIPFILGASFPALFKKAVQSASARNLGSGDNERSFQDVVNTYFQA